MQVEAPPEGRIPDFFVVGHPKCGTTAMYEMLRRHPQVFMPDLKEPRYLDERSRSRMADRPEFPKTLDEYLALFAPARADQVAGEATPSYLRSESAPRAIAELQPAARCIAIFREPASFVRSYHLHARKYGLEAEKDLRTALLTEKRTRDGVVTRRYSDLVRYVDQLRRFHSVVPRDRTLILIYEEFRRDNEATLRQVFRFLGVDDSVHVAALDANESVRLRGRWLDGAVGYVYDGRSPVTAQMRRAAKAVLPDRLGKVPGRVRRKVVYTAPPPVDEELMAELRVRYRPEVEALGEYLGRDLVSLWRYDA